MKRGMIVALLLVLITAIVVPASLTFAKSKKVKVLATQTVAQLEAKYVAATDPKKKVRILIVPGHEPGYGGAEYQGVYEREITVETAAQLAADLAVNSRFEVIVARSNTAWNDDLSDYFDKKMDAIEDFVTDQKEAFAKLLKRGRVTQRDGDDQVAHAAAPDDVALRLYGIGKWANENNIDLVVHLHINDAPDHGPNDPSPNSGFAVYVPDSQYGNAATSRPLGDAIARRLSATNATSSLPVENKGVVEDQELIALGAYDTLSVPSVLIEYGYITEPRFAYPEVRSVVTKEYAYETYLGIQDFFNDTPVVKYPSVSLPYTFASTSVRTSASPATYSLQVALHTLGFYPAYASTSSSTMPVAPRTLTECPIDGVMTACTMNGIMTFQRAKGIPATGMIDAPTAYLLNQMFSDQPVVAPILPVSSTPVVTTASCALPEAGITLGTQDKGVNGSVTKLQKLLATDASLYSQKLVTGFFGPTTLAAVQKFQVSHAITAKGSAGYGLIGPKTIAALKAQYCP